MNLYCFAGSFGLSTPCLACTNDLNLVFCICELDWEHLEESDLTEDIGRVVRHLVREGDARYRCGHRATTIDVAPAIHHALCPTPNWPPHR